MEQQPGKLTNTYQQIMFYSVIFVIAVCSALHYLIFIRTVQRWKKSNIPFLRPMFLFGHKYFLNGGKYSSTAVFDRIYKENENKDMVAFFMMTTPVIMVKNTKLIQQIFVKNFDKTYQNGLSVLKDDIEMQSLIIVTPDKKEWRNGRSILAPVFSTSRLHGPPEFAKIKKQIDKLLEYAKSAESEKRPMDVHEGTVNFVLDSIALLQFGMDVDSFQEKEEMYKISRSVFAPSYAIMFKLLVMTHFPALQAFDMFRFITQRHKSFFKNFLMEQFELRNKCTTKYNDLIDHFISLQQKEYSNEDNSNGSMQKNEALHIRRLIGYSLSVLLASTHTPAISAAYALHLLSLHPEYQDRIKDEIDGAMVKHQVTEFTPQVVKQLQFTEQCVLEAERLYPPFAFIMRRCTDDIQIPDTSFSLKKGDKVIICPYAIHRDPKNFKNPDKFDPERFSPENKGSISSDAFLAFGCGPKKCPAYKQGNFLAVACVAALLHQYEVRPHSHFRQIDATDFDPKSATNHHKGDLLVKLIRRENVAAKTS